MSMLLIPKFIIALFVASHLQALSSTDMSVFCDSNPKAVACDGHHGRTLSFVELQRVDAPLREEFVYVDSNVRTNKGHKGNCSDYALILSERLAAAGEDGRNLTIVSMVQCDPHDKPLCDGHTRLWVKTSDHGEVEVDNMFAPRALTPDGVWFDFMVEDGNQITVPARGFHETLTGPSLDGAPPA